MQQHLTHFVAYLKYKTFIATQMIKTTMSKLEIFLFAIEIYILAVKTFLNKTCSFAKGI